MSAPNSAGVLDARSMPWATNFSRMSSNGTMRTISRFPFAISGAGRPYRGVTSKPATPDSATVGRSGACGVRLAGDTASARNRSVRPCGIAVSRLLNIICTWPPASSVSAAESRGEGGHEDEGQLGL